MFPRTRPGVSSFQEKVRSPNEIRGIDSLRMFVMVELFVQAGQFGFVASGLLPKRVGRAHLGSSRRGEAVRRGGGGVLQRQGGGGALLCRGGGGGVCLRRDQAAARMPRPSTFFTASNKDQDQSFVYILNETFY